MGRRGGLTYRAERQRLADGCTVIAGIDEAGRGPWAGPVVAAAVVLNPRRVPKGLNDSKKLSPEVRAELAEEIRATARVGVGIAGVARIDRDNILAATLWAMHAALKGLGDVPDLALIDGNRLPDLPCAAEAIVEGDGKIASIAAASIIAKVTRDCLMVEMAETYPDYGFERHKGYGTAQHQDALARLGPCPEHRRSFKPILAYLG